MRKIRCALTAAFLILILSVSAAFYADAANATVYKNIGDTFTFYSDLYYPGKVTLMGGSYNYNINEYYDPDEGYTYVMEFVSEGECDLMISYRDAGSDRTQLITFKVKSPLSSDDECIVKLDPNGGECDCKTLDLIQGKPFGKLPVPQKNGYDFEGWMLDSIITETDTVPECYETVLTAVWKAKTYTVLYEINGEIKSSSIVTYDENLGKMPDAYSEGMHFEGWYTSAEGGTQLCASSVCKFKNDITLYAHFSNKEAENITVSLDAAGGNCPEEKIEIKNYDLFGEIPDSTHEGFVFEGWFTEKTGGYRILPDMTVPADCPDTLYARFTVENTESVTFISNGGIISFNSKSVKSGKAIGELPEAERDGYEFIGWYYSVYDTDTGLFRDCYIDEETIVAPDFPKSIIADFKEITNLSLSIRGYKEEYTVDYLTTVILRAKLEYGSKAHVVWLDESGKMVAFETECKLRNVKSDFSVKAVYIENGEIIAETETETIKVKNGFFDRIRVFFKTLFGGELPIYDQKI